MLSILTGIPGETTLYLTIDTVFEKDSTVQYSVEFLNTLYLPDVPPYKLDLKVGDPVDATAELGSTSILLWHQTYSEGVKVKHSRSHRLHWMYQTRYGSPCFDSNHPLLLTMFTFQFTLKVTFAMTSNKTQLKLPAFTRNKSCSHGQLSVACSRILTVTQQTFVHIQSNKNAFVNFM